MSIRRLAAEGVLALGLVAAACGGSSGDGGSLSAPATDAAGTATEVVVSDAAPLGEGSLGAPTPASAVDGGPVSALALFLPPDAAVTPDGDAIIREPTDELPAPHAVDWKTNWDVRIIALEELSGGGPARDGIRPIDAPKFVDVGAADEAYYADTSPVIRIEVNGDVRAYGLDILIWHEIVNDIVGGVPIAVTYC